uniref:Right handed beta helix domain-containing protein n=1 Tax=Eutreptiella gymnastica TaxID=73025 RepID=A0A7S1NFH5_9EUGL|mmetsp:Transcript_27856/g.50251  ORF Transcript_27856/g.50251 Transcript_27856/m.50251 type:complete len:417 (+) Transcript_27856:85-1335(+)
MASVPCPFAIYGCSAKQLRVTELEQHLTAEAPEHLNLVCIELVKRKDFARTQHQKQEQEWQRELNLFKSVAHAREAELTSEMALLQQKIAAQDLTVQRLMQGSVVVVDGAGCGLFTTIGAALACCQSGDTVVVRPGEYTEALVLPSADLTIRGSGPERTVVRLGAEAALVRVDTVAAITGLRLVQEHSEFPCVSVSGAGADLRLEDCDISALGGPCVEVAAESRVLVHGSKVHGSNDSGIVFHSGSAGSVERSWVSGCGVNNIHLRPGADVALRHNKVFDSLGCGIRAEQVDSQILHNDVYHNVIHNVAVVSGSPHIAHNTIHHSPGVGIDIMEGSRCTVSDNDVGHNDECNVVLGPGTEASIVKNTIHHSRRHGVLVKAKACGEVVNNHIHDNIGQAVKTDTGTATVKVQGNKLR